MTQVIPIVRDHEQVGTISVTGDEFHVTGNPKLPYPWGGPEPLSNEAPEQVVYVYEQPIGIVYVSEPAPDVREAEPPARVDLDAARELVESIPTNVYEQLVQEPRWRQAAEQGRRVYEKACALAREKKISYAEALARVLS